MPIYEYECQTCGEEFEEIQKFSDPPLKKHTCSPKSVVRRKISLNAFLLKGGGWYSEGYAKGKDGSANGAGGKDSAGGKESAGGKDGAGDGSGKSASGDAKAGGGGNDSAGKKSGSGAGEKSGSGTSPASG